MNFEKFLRIPFLQNTSDGCFCILLQDDLVPYIVLVKDGSHLQIKELTQDGKIYTKQMVEISLFPPFFTWCIDQKVTSRSSHRRCSVKKVFLKILQNSQENTFCNFIKKETLAHFFYRRLPDDFFQSVPVWFFLLLTLKFIVNKKQPPKLPKNFLRIHRKHPRWHPFLSKVAGLSRPGEAAALNLSLFFSVLTFNIFELYR